jgi:hypothetical protein
MILGNEAAHIETCLRSFAPAFDVLSVVIAIGNQQPDDTHLIVGRICEEMGKPYHLSYYKNEFSCREWPHVDDFGAARQQSFMQAANYEGTRTCPTVDWLFWTDADDIAHPDTPIEKLREVAASGAAPAYGFPYDVVGTGKRPPRERLFSADLFRDGTARWSRGIHENITGVQVMAHESPVWRHAPAACKPASKERNVRIIHHHIRDAAVNAFYIFQEHNLRGEKESAIQWGDAALNFPGLPDAFRYEIYLGFVKHRPRSEAPRWAAMAFVLYPACREALAYMALLRMELGHYDIALVLAHRMLHIPPPPIESRPWSYEPKWYGWAAHDLVARLMRLTGSASHESSAAEDAMRTGRPPTISLVHATRGRHQTALLCRDRWLALADHPEEIETILCVDDDDRESLGFAKQFPHVVVEAGGGCVRAWNAGAEKARGSIFVQLSDDWIPCQGWDRKIMTEIEREGKSLSDEWVIAVHDGHRNDDLLCMAILSRARWVRQGREMFSAEYLSVYSDNEFSHRAWRDGVVIDARSRIAFEHQHPAFGKAAMDATYAASNAPERYEQGREIFIRRNPDAAAVPLLAA